MKKLWSLVLALALVLTLAPAISVSAEAEEPITLRMSAAAVYSFDPETDPMAKKVRDEFGIIFEDVPYEGDFTKMMLDAQSGTLADVMYTEPLYDLYSFATLIDAGYFRAIPDELLEKYPSMYKQMNDSKVAEAVKAHFGGNYLIPKPDSLDPTIYIGERKGIYVRKDWMEAVGVSEVPTTWDEFYELAKKFTLEDPDQNGVDDTMGLTGDTIGNLRYYFSCLGHSNMNWVKQTDGTWIHGALMEDNIQILEILRKMYNEGFIDPEQGATDYTQAMQKFASNSFGMVIRNADADWLNTVIVKNYWEANKDKGNPFDRVDLIPALALTKDQLPTMDKYIDCMCATMVSADLSDENLDRYMKFHEWTMTEEGDFTRLGTKDVDWKYDENGKIVKIPNADGTMPDLAALYPSLPVFSMPSWGFHIAANPKIQSYDNFNDETKEMSARVSAVRNANVVESDMRVKLISAQSMLDANSFKFTAEYWGIVSGTDPVDVMFKDMVDRAMASGFEQAIKDVNEICTANGW